MHEFLGKAFREQAKDPKLPTQIEKDKALKEYLAKPFFEQVKELEELAEEANRRD